METNFTLKFGKFKGQEFQNTPLWYQQWLVAQDWFKVPTQLTPMQEAQKSISQLSSQLKGWNGYSRKGTAIYDAIFEQEQKIEDLLYCDCGNRKNEDEKDCGCGGIYAL